MTRADMAPVIIIGGGISGLATAYYLRQAGIRSVLVERRSYLGGVITTDIVDRCVIEGGPDSYLAAKPWAEDLIRDLGLESEIIGSNDHLRVTYIKKNGRLIPMPDGLMMMVPTRVLPMVTTPLLSWPTKIRMALELFRRSPEGKAPDRSVAEFIEDHYGPEAVEYLAEPLLAGVYGGSPRKLSVISVLNRFVELEERYGSLARGVLAAMKKQSRSKEPGGTLFRSLKNGLGSLTGALQQSIADSTRVIQGSAEVLEASNGGFRVRVGGEWLHDAEVVLACQAYEAASVVRELDSDLAGVLESIPYNSSMTVALGYEKSRFAHALNGFGFLVPQCERSRMIACTWVGTKFANRVPEDRVMLRAFLGGADDPDVLQEPDENVIRIVRKELCEIMGVTETPCFTRVSRWPASMAQYTVGHQERVARIAECVSRHPGLHLAGNAYSGIGVPDCIRMGKQAAEIIARSRLA